MQDFYFLFSVSKSNKYHCIQESTRGSVTEDGDICGERDAGGTNELSALISVAIAIIPRANHIIGSKARIFFM